VEFGARKDGLGLDLEEDLVDGGRGQLLGNVLLLAVENGLQVVFVLVVPLLVLRLQLLASQLEGVSLVAEALSHFCSSHPCFLFQNSRLYLLEVNVRHHPSPIPNEYQVEQHQHPEY